MDKSQLFPLAEVGAKLLFRFQIIARTGTKGAALFITTNLPFLRLDLGFQWQDLIGSNSALRHASAWPVWSGLHNVLAS